MCKINQKGISGPNLIMSVIHSAPFIECLHFVRVWVGFVNRKSKTTTKENKTNQETKNTFPGFKEHKFKRRRETL